MANKNIARFISCTQAQYDSIYKKENNNEEIENITKNNYDIKEIKDDNNSKSYSGKV